MKRKQFSEEEINRIKKMYTEEHLGATTICNEFGVTGATIRRVLRENNIVIGIPGRKWTGGLKESRKRYEVKHKEERDLYKKDWFQNNKEYRKQYHKEWREKNKESYQEYKRVYEKTKKDSDPKYRLASYTRTAIYTSLKERNINKYKNTFELLPYTLEQLIQHLEGGFEENMTWENYGKWHVDHIKPMSLFKFKNSEDKEFQECWSLKNLQPLWGMDNLSKGSKYL